MTLDSHDPRERTPGEPAAVKEVLSRLAWFVLPACALLPLSYFVPRLNPWEGPYFDLTGPWAVAAYGLSESASERWLPLIAMVMIAFLTLRWGVSWKQRSLEAGSMALALVLLLGGGAYLNEHVIKPGFGVPRPNLLWLGKPPEAPALGMSVREFYDLPDKASRSTYLAAVLAADGFTAVNLRECVREHWIAETGYSFPSGHSTAAMMFATFGLAMGLTYFSGRRRLWGFYLLLAWAVAACYSRLILRVHSPLDITVGGLQGVMLGIVAFLVVRQVVATTEADGRPV